MKPILITIAIMTTIFSYKAKSLSCVPDEARGIIKSIEDHSHKSTSTYLIVHLNLPGGEFICGDYEGHITIHRNNLSESTLREIKKNIYLAFTTGAKITLPKIENQAIFDDNKPIKLSK